MLIFLAYMKCYAPDCITFNTFNLTKCDAVIIRMPEKVTSEVIYERLYTAIRKYESVDGKFLFNAKENAVGPVQIRQCKLDDYNRLTGKHYLLQDCYREDVSREIFFYFATGKSYEQASKKWNGSGPMTEVYWNNIKNLL